MGVGGIMIIKFRYYGFDHTSHIKAPVWRFEDSFNIGDYKIPKVDYTDGNKNKDYSGIGWQAHYCIPIAKWLMRHRKRRAV